MDRIALQSIATIRLKVSAEHPTILGQVHGGATSRKVQIDQRV